MKRMAIMTGVSFGMRDCAAPVLWFTADEGDLASLQILSVEQAVKVILDHHIYDIEQLEGKPCWVEHDDAKGTSRFVDIVKIAKGK